jgi:hypothetical protein
MLRLASRPSRKPLSRAVRHTKEIFANTTRWHGIGKETNLHYGSMHPLATLVIVMISVVDVMSLHIDIVVAKK